MDRAVLTRLVAVLGADAVTDDGIVTPRSTDGVVAVCRICTETGMPMVVTSGLISPRPDGLVVSVTALHDVRVNPARGVAYAGAGATIYHLREAVSREGLSLAGPQSTGSSQHVGSLIARGLLPPRALTGVIAVLPTGERISTQGAVARDSTGYNISGALLGSMGRLAVITGAYFRLQREGVELPMGEAPGSPRPSLASELVRQGMDPAGLLRSAAEPA